MPRRLSELLVGTALFLARLYGPLTVLCIASVGFFAWIASVAGWFVLAGQLCCWWLTDLLVTHRAPRRRLIATIPAADPNDTLPEWLMWFFISIASLVVSVLCVCYPEGIAPALILFVPHAIGLSLVAADRSAYATFEEAVLAPLLAARRQAQAEQEQKNREREEQRRLKEAEQERKRQQAEAERRSRPKALPEQLEQMKATHEKLLSQIRSLKIDEEMKSQLIESLETSFRDGLFRLTEKEPFGI